MKTPTKLKARMFNGKEAPEWATHVLCICDGYDDNRYFWEEGTTQEKGKRYQGMRYGAVVNYYDDNTSSAGEFVYELPPVSPALDEALPAAPKSGLYLSGTGQRKLSVFLHRPQRDWFPNDEGNVQFKIDGMERTVRLSPETARDLASDLYRMARQLEKDNK